MSSSHQNQSSSSASSSPTSKSPRKTSVFLFGSTGFLGQELLSVLCSTHQKQEHYNKRFSVSALIRPETLESKEELKTAAMSKLKAAGVTLISGDVEKATVEHIAKWIAGNDIVLSTISYYGSGSLPDMKILEAVKVAKVPWFIPSAFGVDVSSATVDSVPGILSRKLLLESIRKAGVNYIFFCNGILTEYLLSPFNGVDSVHLCITAPYSFDAKVTTTTAKDVAHLVVEALIRREEGCVKNQVVKFAGDTLTFEHIHRLMEDKYKKAYKKVVVSREDAMAAVKADTSMKNIVGRFRVIFGEQKGVWWDVMDSWNYKHARHVRTTTVAQYLQNMD